MIVVVSTRFVLIYTSAGPPHSKSLLSLVIVFESLGSERAPSPFDESVWQGGARRNAPKGRKKMSSFGCVGVIYSPFVVGCCIERFSRLASLSWLGVDPQKPPSGWPFSFFLLLLLPSLGCILTICYLFK
jgi:hypothetical protein